TVVRCVTWTPAHGCGPMFSRCSIRGRSVQRARRRLWPAAAPADPGGRDDAERQQRDEHLRQAPPDPELLDAEPLAVGQAAVADGQVLTPQAPREAVQCGRSPLGAGHVLRLRVADAAVLVDQVGRQGGETRLSDWT